MRCSCPSPQEKQSFLIEFIYNLYIIYIYIYTYIYIYIYMYVTMINDYVRNINDIWLKV